MCLEIWYAIFKFLKSLGFFKMCSVCCKSTHILSILANLFHNYALLWTFTNSGVIDYKWGGLGNCCPQGCPMVTIAAFLLMLTIYEACVPVVTANCYFMTGY